MEFESFSAKIRLAFEQNDFSELLDDNKIGKLFDFSCLLVETNKVHNLTAITDEDGIILKHLLDSTSICEFIPQNSSLIDVGCGAGFPSIPVAILREDVRIVSIDSTEKKIRFIDDVCKKLNIGNIYPVAGRAEDYVKQARESFDVAVSRAVARLNILDELCLPFVKVGGRFISMKSSKGEEELSEAQSGILKLGGKQVDRVCRALTFNDDTIEREIYIFSKEKPTPDRYPRNYSQIVKKPL
ncbi:MAG: 16S rRNA (guanine(527)-N(7))-methyltransferase RsmG [Eubacteriales bacterium]